MKKSLLITLIIVGFSLFQTKSFAQTTIEVTNVSNSGIGSLRQAIIDANPGDIIEFNSSIDGQKIILSSSITIEKDLTINGNGATNTIIDGNNQDRVFMIFKSGNQITVAINGITIQNGRIYGNNLAGAGIFNTENLTLTGCSIINNEATFNTIGSKTYGGGINSSIGVLTLINCLVTGNSCLTEGGGIRATGNLIIVNSTIVKNKAYDFTVPVGVPPTTEGGGIYFAIGNTFEIYNSIVWDNFANFDEQIFGVNFIDVANNSIVEGLVISGSGNIDGTNPANAPMFLDNQGYTGNFHLQANSSLIDKGNNNAISEIIDLDELTRVKGSYGNTIPKVDLGCYEYQFDQFVTSWKTDNPGISNNDQITVPANTFFYTYNYSVDWGDGNSDSNIISSITHTYAVPGIYSISISGNYPNINLSGAQDGEKLLSVISWGNNPWVNMKNSFMGCSNLILSNTIDAPNLSNVTDAFGMFRDATSVNEGLENWDVSTITNMAWMFGGATSFNGDINSWNVNNVSTFSAMFKGATSYNRLINSWDTSGAVSMDGMFQDATSFNRYIGSWDVSSVELFAYMFKDATAFNQNLENWDISGADSVAQMFSGATSFNQDIGNWDISGLNNSRPASIAGAN
ncbi:MAG: DUF285 domain-containing protein, partial [Flavobacteriaceae bacterium]|nr:DUF285 domain-containing protein [Flavobacteriaceae bacterium]